MKALYVAILQFVMLIFSLDATVGVFIGVCFSSFVCFWGGSWCILHAYVDVYNIESFIDYTIFIVLLCMCIIKM